MSDGERLAGGEEGEEEDREEVSDLNWSVVVQRCAEDVRKVSGCQSQSVAVLGGEQ